MKDFFRDDSAQATTEYILILAIAISFFLMVSVKFIKPFAKKYQANIAKALNARLFQGDLHHFPLSR